MILADDELEIAQFKRMQSIWRSKFKCLDVGGLMHLSREQLEDAALQAVDENGVKGTVRMVLQYLGAKGCPHVPPAIKSSNAFETMIGNDGNKIMFGRAGKTGRDSSEHNFPDAMFPSSRMTFTRVADVKIPRELNHWLKSRAASYNEFNRMPQEVTMRMAEEVADWIVSVFGTSPVSS